MEQKIKFNICLLWENQKHKNLCNGFNIFFLIRGFLSLKIEAGTDTQILLSSCLLRTSAAMSYPCFNLEFSSLVS